MQARFSLPSPALDALIERHWNSISDDDSKPIDSQAIYNEGTFIVEILDPSTVGFLSFQPSGTFTYQVHVTTDMTGQRAVDAGRVAIDLMFTHTDCQMIVARCPDHNPKVLAYAYACGFTREIHSPSTHTKDGKRYGSTLASLSMQRWLIKRCDGNLLVAGQICQHIQDQSKALNLFNSVRGMLHPITSRMK